MCVYMFICLFIYLSIYSLIYLIIYLFLYIYIINCVLHTITLQNISSSFILNERLTKIRFYYGVLSALDELLRILSSHSNRLPQGRPWSPDDPSASSGSSH